MNAGSNAAYQWSPLAPATASYSRNGLNQYTAVAGTSFSYDARGNLTGDGTRTYAFDVYNRLTSVGGAATMTLAYDPAGRLYETAAASTTRFLYDGSALIGEFNTAGTLLRRTVQGADGEPLVWYEGAGTTDRRYLMTNEQGSVIAADAGSGVTAYSYDDYGNPNAWSSPGTAPRQRYAGTMMLAEAQLYHMGARAYAPGIGRFLQTDPILFAGGVNLYAYVENDPVNAVDPSGLKVVCDNRGCRETEKDRVVVTGRRRNLEVLQELKNEQENAEDPTPCTAANNCESVVVIGPRKKHDRPKPKPIRAGFEIPSVHIFPKGSCAEACAKEVGENLERYGAWILGGELAAEEAFARWASRGRESGLTLRYLRAVRAGDTAAMAETLPPLVLGAATAVAIIATFEFGRCYASKCEGR